MSDWTSYINSVEDGEFISAVMEQQWFIAPNDSHNLYISDPWGDEWVETGCDPKIENGLNTWWREHGFTTDDGKVREVPEQVYKALGLELVPDVLKRWEDASTPDERRARFYNA